MKAAILTIVLLVTHLFALAQDTAKTNLAIFKIPRGAQRLDTAQYQRYGTTNFNKFYITMPGDHTYLYNGLLVTIRELYDPVTNKSLESSKGEFEEVFRTGSGTIKIKRSEIITVNNMRFLCSDLPITSSIV